MTNWLTTHLTAIIAPLAIMGVLGILIKKIPEMLGDKAIELIDKVFAAGTPVDDKLFVAALVWAEERFGPGTGDQKAAFLVDKGINLLPLQYRIFITPKVKERMQTLFQVTFTRLESVFLAQIKEHSGIPADAVPPVIPKP